MIKRTIKIFIMFMFIVATYNVVSKAAISAASKTVNSGENVSILVTSNVQVSAYTVRVTGYDGLTFVTSSGGSGAGTTSISDAKATGGMTNLATFQFKAPSVEKDQTFQVTFSATGMGDINLNALPDSSCTANITVKGSNQGTGGVANNGQTPASSENPTTSTKSTVATLSNLGIRPNDFTGFRPSTYSYNVEVPNDTETIEVYASKGQSGQTISGTGTKTLKEGVNTFNVVVTAEAGNTQTYTINVTRTAKEEQIEDNEQPEENPGEDPMEEIFGLSELNIEGVELEPQFQTDVYEYKVELKEDIEKLNITTLATEANSNIEITGNENFQEGENIITIVVKGQDEEKIATYQIIVNKTLEEQENTVNQEQDHQQMIKKIIVISVAGGVILIIVIATIIVKVKKSKKSIDGYIPYENLTDDYEDDYEVNEIEEQTFEDTKDDEFYEEEHKKKKRSKGKRFK